MKRILAIFFLLVGTSFARTFTTNFPLTENPISEGGNWTNGKTVGLDWSNVQTSPGFAFGTQVPYSGTFNGIYNDSTALVTGTWAGDQSCQATVGIVNYPNLSNGNEEVELRLRSSISAHINSGYEINFRIANDANSYVEIIRWNGPIGNYTALIHNAGSQYGISNGSVVKATISGNVITTYINGVQVAQATDSTFTTGNPGIGFWLSRNPGVGTDFGFTNFTATDSGGGGGDTTVPSAPTNLIATAISSSQINLTWTAATDNIAVTGYNVYRNGALVGTVTGTSYSSISLSSNTLYSFNVVAYDAAGNVSSSVASATTQGTSDTTAPTVPTNLTAVPASSSQINLAWTAATDGVGVTGYKIFRGGSQIATSGSTSYSNTALAASTAYSYTVAAYDVAGNTSAQSTSASTTTTSPSSVPMSFNFTIPGGTAVSGYTNDVGAFFNSSLGYGWTTLPDSRLRGVNANPLLDSFIFSSGATITWNLDISNGNYLVTLASGDASWSQGPHRVVVEGTTVINNQVTAMNQFIAVSNIPVTVYDGKLTVTIGGGGGTTMLNYLTIQGQ